MAESRARIQKQAPQGLPPATEHHSASSFAKHHDAEALGAQQGHGRCQADNSPADDRHVVSSQASHRSPLCNGVALAANGRPRGRADRDHSPRSKRRPRPLVAALQAKPSSTTSGCFYSGEVILRFQHHDAEALGAQQGHGRCQADNSPADDRHVVSSQASHRSPLCNGVALAANGRPRGRADRDHSPRSKRRPRPLVAALQAKPSSTTSGCFYSGATILQRAQQWPNHGRVFRSRRRRGCRRRRSTTRPAASPGRTHRRTHPAHWLHRRCPRGLGAGQLFGEQLLPSPW